MLFDRPLEGIWEDRTKRWHLRQRGEEVSRKDVTRKTLLTLVPLPSWRGLSVEERRKRVLGLIQDIEKEAAAEREKTGRKPMGAERILKQSPLSTPVNPVKPPRAPLFHARGDIYVMLLQQYREFVAQFRQAAEMLKNGDTNAPFPVGSFPPGLPFVPAQPPPFAKPP